MSSAIGFDMFYAMFPRKEAKAAARVRWDKVVKDTPPAVIIAALELQIKAGIFEEKRANALREGKARDHYIKQPARWLNAGCWEDEIVPRARPQFRNGAMEALARHTEANWTGFDDNLIEGPANG